MTVDSASSATKTVRAALTEAGVGTSDYDVSSRTTDDGVVTLVIANGWLPAEGREIIAEALKNVDGRPKVKRSGSEFTLTF